MKMMTGAYTSWVSKPDVEALESIFRSELKDFFIDLEEKPLESFEDLMKEYEASDEADFSIFYINYFKGYFKERMEKDMISRIKSFQDLSSELKDKLGGRSIKKAYSSDRAIDKDMEREFIFMAFSGILIDCIREMLVERSPLAIASDKLGIFDGELLKFKILFTVFKKNGYKYGDIDLSKELEGMTIDSDTFDSFIEECGSAISKYKGGKEYVAEKFGEAIEKIEKDTKERFEAFDKKIVEAAQSSSDFTTMFFKGKAMKELESKFKVDDEEEEAKPTDMKSRVIELVKAAGDDEELLRKIEEMIKGNK